MLTKINLPVIGVSLSEPHTSESNGAIFIYYWGERERAPH